MSAAARGYPARPSTRGPRAANPLRTMAKSKIKAGGPTRGRKRVRKIGMGSGEAIAKARKKSR